MEVPIAIIAGLLLLDACTSFGVAIESINTGRAIGAILRGLLSACIVFLAIAPLLP